MQTAAIAFNRFKTLRDDACRIASWPRKAALGKRAVILGHHYQRADVYRHADLTGDSLKLSRLAAQTDAELHRVLRRAFHGGGRRHPVEAARRSRSCRT